MTYPGSAPPRSPDRTATLITSVIGAVALIAALLIAVITSDSASSALGQPETGTSDSGGSEVSGGGSVSNEGGSSTVVSVAPAPTPVQVTPSPVPTPVPAPSVTATPSPTTSSSTTSAKPRAAQLRATFPTPPHTKKVSSYASLSKPKDEDWFVSTSSLGTVHLFYVKLFKKSGWTTYIKPSVYKDSSGKVNGYFSIYHLDEKVTADLSLDKNYLDEKPGTVLIKSQISDD